MHAPSCYHGNRKHEFDEDIYRYNEEEEDDAEDIYGDLVSLVNAFKKVTVIPKVVTVAMW